MVKGGALAIATTVVLMTVSLDMRLAALRDPEYHRYLMFGRADEIRAKQLGRALHPYEAQSRLPWPQLEIINRIERAIADREGEVIAVLMARQTGKNETEAFLETRALSAWRGVPGSTWVRAAPTARPQLVNSKRRLEKHLKADPLVRGRWLPREGYIYEAGHAEIQFLSAGPTANVVGATASIALSADEAHKIDAGKFNEDFGPFTASTNAPGILWGVAADKLDMLHEYREKGEGTDRVLVYPADVWCELSKAYAGHYESKVRDLGADHPIVLTQYRMIPVESRGSYLNEAQRASLFSGRHPRLEGPRDGFHYALVVDIGGESEHEIDDDEARALEPERDSTFALVLEWDPAQTVGPDNKIDVRVVNGYWWTGKHHEAATPDVKRVVAHWRAVGGVIDARGVGEATAGAVNREHPVIEPYKATAPEVSEDCYSLLAWLNAGRVKMWTGDPTEDEILRELQAQARHTKYEIRGHEAMRLTKPTGTGSSNRHIDGIKALTYLHRAVKLGPGVGVSTQARDTYRGEFSPFPRGSRSRAFNRSELRRHDEDEA
jgi:hypothetical protein